MRPSGVFGMIWPGAKELEPALGVSIREDRDVWEALLACRLGTTGCETEVWVPDLLDALCRAS